MANISVYTDGSCRCNTGKGGWGAVVIQEDQIQQLSGSESHTTNNRMELLAAIKALDYISSKFDAKSDILVHTDSQYLCRGMNEWVKGWKKRGWLMANGQPMKNSDLWQQLDYFNCLLSVKWKWVRGHAGDKFNEIADALAQEASQDSE